MRLEASNSPKKTKKSSNIKYLKASTLLATILALTPINNTKAQEIYGNLNKTNHPTTAPIPKKTEQSFDISYQQLSANDFKSAENTQEEESGSSNFEVVEADKDTIKEIENAVKEAEKISIQYYTGIFSGTAIPIKSLSTTNSINLRMGANTVVPITNWLDISTISGLNHTDGNTIGMINAGLNFYPEKNTTISAGIITSPAGKNHRSNPFSLGGQFETTTQSLVPASNLGISSRYSFKKAKKEVGNIGAAIYKRNNIPEFTMSGVYKGVKASLWQNTKEKIPNLALTVKHKGICNNFVIKQDDIFNATEIGLKNGIMLLGEFGYNNKNKEFLVGETGIAKMIEKEMFNGLIAGSYDIKNKELKIYLLISVSGTK